MSKEVHITQFTWNQAPINIIKGAVIGVGAILPGISGGALCVVFGIYRPMMEFLSHPVKAFRSFYKLLLPVLIGWVIGFLGLAKLVSIVMESQPAPAVWLFIGLIIGTLPSLFKTAGEKGRTAASWTAFAVSFAIFLGYMGFLSLSNAINIQPNLIWWLICGALWGFSLIVPGMSSSSLLMFLGLYYPLTAGISNFDISVIIPFIIGIAAIVLAFSRFVNWLFERAYAVMHHILLGFVCASTIAIIPINETSYDALHIAIYVGCFAVGLVIALAMDALGRSLEGKKQTEGESL